MAVGVVLDDRFPAVAAIDDVIDGLLGGNINPAPGETFSQIRERVVVARRRQQEQYAGKRSITCIARMGARKLSGFGALDEATRESLEMAMNELKLSARAYDRILKVARTIADPAGSERLRMPSTAQVYGYLLTHAFGSLTFTQPLGVAAHYGSLSR